MCVVCMKICAMTCSICHIVSVVCMKIYAMTCSICRIVSVVDVVYACTYRYPIEPALLYRLDTCVVECKCKSEFNYIEINVL